MVGHVLFCFRKTRVFGQMCSRLSDAAGSPAGHHTEVCVDSPCFSTREGSEELLRFSHAVIWSHLAVNIEKFDLQFFQSTSLLFLSVPTTFLLIICTHVEITAQSFFFPK